MKKSVIAIGMLVICFSLTGCGDDKTSNANATRDTEFTVILQQLELTRGEVRALRADITKISRDIEKLRSQADDRAAIATAPVAPVNPAAAATLALEKDDISLGNPDARIAIVEFTDYQCPYCLRFHQSAYSEIKKNYIDTGKVRYVVRDFPLDFHAEARSAAIAVNCADKQGKYWEMRDELFANQTSLGDTLYARLATQLDLDEGSFKSCIGQEDVAKLVQSDVSYGESIGVRGTPNFFVGRIDDANLVDIQQITGAQPYRAFSNAIDSLIN